MQEKPNQFIPLYTLTVQEIERFLRVPLQVLVAPWVSALLYIFIFGSIIGPRVGEIMGVPYIDFILPGILMMQLISSAFMEGSSGIYFKRFIKSIEEILVAPIPNWMIIASLVIAGIVRALLVGAGIFAIAIFFGGANLAHLPVFIFATVFVAAVFTLLGIVVGMWAKNFEQLGVLNIFAIMPLSYLGGVFYSISMLPESVRGLVLWNPFFYFVDLLRYSMIGYSESSLLLGAAGTVLLSVLLFGVVWRLFAVGYGIRS